MNVSAEHYDPYPFEGFAPTLSQCFIIVIVGYLIARLEILSTSDVRGVVGFASYFAMPGIICISLADADFSDFRWELLFGIFLGKCLIFLLVAGFLILINHNLGVAGIVGLFCAQSNDLPVGNPLMSSLYKDHRPQMMKYLFLFPAMTVITFSSFSNIMVRVHRMKSSSSRQGSKSHPVLKECLSRCFQDMEHLNQVYGIIKNPVVIATALGLVLNVIFRGDMPEVMHRPIKVAAETIPGIALAMLGFSFVRKERYLISSAVVPAAVLLIIKMVLTPILLHAILKALTDSSERSKLLTDFSLLYGIISPATAVFQFGQEFRKSFAVMSVALILSSFGCFPVSYIVARITIAPVHRLSYYVPLLKCILFWTACISISCDLMILIPMLWKKRWRQRSCCYTMYFAFTQIITCAGLLVWILAGHLTWATYCSMALYYGGEISGYLWTGILALVLAFKEKCTLFAEDRILILCFAVFSVSVLITTVMCILLPYGEVKSVYVIGRPRSDFEFFQLVVTSILLVTCLIIVAVCLIYHFKRRKIRNESSEICTYENTVFYIQEQKETTKKCHISQESVTSVKIDAKLAESDEAKLYYDEVVRNEGSIQNEMSLKRREYTFRITSLLIFQGLIMLIRFIASLFKLFDSKSLEIMVPVEFLQSTLFVGQGIFIFLTIGVDVRTAVITLRKWWRAVRHGSEETVFNLANVEPKGEIVQFCNKFYNFYYSRCFRDIASDRQWKDAVYQNSFWGHQLVDWMIVEGLCQEDTEAEERGQKLLAGGVIEHVNGRHCFYDAPYLYRFRQEKRQIVNEEHSECK